MKSGLDPVLPRDLTELLHRTLKYKWPVEYVILKDGSLWAEEVVTEDTAGDPLPCPSIDMTIRFLEKEMGIIVEPEYDLSSRGSWRYKVIWIGDSYVTVLGRVFPSKDSALLEGIKDALERIEYERRH